MPNRINDKMLQQVTENMTGNKQVHGAILRVESGDGSLTWNGAAGNLHPDQRFFIASVTKLFMTALVLRLQEEEQLNLDHPILQYLPVEVLTGLHVRNGVDHTREITIRHLISNTSGLPDYFSQKNQGGRSVAASLMAGNDQPWGLEKTLEAIEGMTPKFTPGQPGKVQYSDTNYQLLGWIIETVTGKPLAEVFRETLFDPLGLENTYAYQDITDTSPAPLHYKSNQIHLPRYVASITAEGGIVSNARELMIFLKAFFSGRFFRKETIQELKQWRLIFFPGQFYFGVGLEKLWIPRIASPFKPIGEMLGFWGQSGAFAFHNPQSDLFFTGTINQLSGMGHSAAFKAMVKIIKAY